MEAWQQIANLDVDRPIGDILGRNWPINPHFDHSIAYHVTEVLNTLDPNNPTDLDKLENETWINDHFNLRAHFGDHATGWAIEKVDNAGVEL